MGGDSVYITFELSNGKTVTRPRNATYLAADCGEMCSCASALGECWAINYDHVVLMREATAEEIEHCKIHGY